ncbi:ubiquinol-cytochrome c reductase [Hypericibacter adhaerens]|uniref:Ubiquinol-cytochrome c reductase n=1 Tax=Hypericibacter adhaerens TaxID=2602016 RepID=A0A5J6NB58_9PROT|nr:EVE domain-containing protein [Hypericibacter adhaerens]QEX25216.1 ubiquinol-cytochrome c reductase [Hypericibacter adhaerens]
MAYWLVKSEPSVYGWEQLVKEGKTHWNGVRNHQAAANLKAMKAGDRALFYHSNEGLAVVGIAEITKTAYPDPTDKTGKFVMVDLKPVTAMKQPVTLASIKAEPKLKDIALVRLSRLSVQPVDAAAWKLICKMGGVKPD